MLDKFKGLKDLKEVAKSHVQAAKPAAEDATRYLVGLDIGTEYVKALVGRVTDGEIEIIGARPGTPGSQRHASWGSGGHRRGSRELR